MIKKEKERKPLSKLGIERHCLNLIKTYKKTTTYIILSGKKVEAFPLRTGTRQGFLLTTSLQHHAGHPC